MIETENDNNPVEYWYWDSHPEHPVSDWKMEVESGQTRLGYWAWVRTRQSET